MGRKFQAARFGGATAPETQSMVYTNGQAFKKGAVLVKDAATGRVIEAVGDPAAASIVGVANEDADSKPGWGVGHSASVVATTGRVQEVSVMKANRNTVFSGRGSANPVLADIGIAYGVVKVGEDWIVDKADVVNTVLRVTDVDLDLNIFFFKFLEGSLANP